MIFSILKYILDVDFQALRIKMVPAFGSSVRPGGSKNIDRFFSKSERLTARFTIIV